MKPKHRLSIIILFNMGIDLVASSRSKINIQPYLSPKSAKSLFILRSKPCGPTVVV